jgi:transposase
MNSKSITPVFAYFGIDVSKETLDICLLRETGKPLFETFDNSPAGHAKLLRWAISQARHAQRRFCIEATGTYGLALSLFLDDASEFISVVNPAHIKYSSGDGAANTTDRASAQKIAMYARLHQPEQWTPPTPQMRELIALVRHRDDLVAQQAQVKTRLADKSPAITPAVRKSLITLLKSFTTLIADIDAQISDHIDSHPDLKREHDLLRTIPGIGEVSAPKLLAEMLPVNQCNSAQSAAAYAGLSPKEHRSGTSVRKTTRLSKAGNKHLRTALFMPALIALKHNSRIIALAARMKAAGKSKMVIVGAAMRKLLMIAYGVLKSGQPFSPEIAKRSNSNTLVQA